MSIFSGISFDFIANLYSIGGFLLSLWWIYIPLILFLFAKDLWIKSRRDKFVGGLEWVLLEVVPPRDIEKTPFAMEQLFAGLHGIQSVPNNRERLVDGVFQRWFSFEMVSQGGEIHFFVRTLSLFRDLIESNIYAQYPEAEISQVADYVDTMPSDLPNDDYSLWGTELVLTKEDAYPIRTYPTFESAATSEEQRVDPISSLLEVINKIGPDEHVWIQTLVRPVKDDWKEDGEKLRDELVGRKEDKEEGFLVKEIKGFGVAAKSVAEEIVTGVPVAPGGDAESKEKEDALFLWKTTKAEQEVIHAIEQNISKFGFDVIIRFVYFAKKDNFSRARVAAVIGSYKQFGTQNLNGFKPNPKVTPNLDFAYQLKETRNTYRKKRVFASYRKREFIPQSEAISYLKPFIFERLPILNWFFIRSKPFVLNVEELATVYHFPITGVKAPLVPKVEAKKGEPPMGLPVK